MAETTVFVPVDRAVAHRWREQGVLTSVTGFAATPELMAALGLTEKSREDADFAAQTHAGISCLLGPETVNRRWVAAAAVPTEDCRAGEWPAFGSVRVEGIAWPAVMALFVDDAEAEDAVQATQQAVAALPFPQAWEHPRSDDLVAEHDLLWYLPSELDQIP